MENLLRCDPPKQDPMHIRLSVGIMGLYGMLKIHSAFYKLDKNKQVGIVYGMERGIFNYVINYTNRHNEISSWINVQFCNRYKLKVFNFCGNGRTPENNVMIQTIVHSNASEWANIPVMSYVTVRSDIFKEAHDNIKIRKHIKINKSYITGLKCPKCKRTGCVKYVGKQTRASDEGESLFAVCDCGYTGSGMSTF